MLEGRSFSLFKKENKEDPGGYRHITLLNLVGKLYSRITNNHLLKYLNLNHNIHKGLGGFWIGRSCIDNIFSFHEVNQGHMKQGKSTYAFFLVLRRLMTRYGGMCYFTERGKLVLKVRCGQWLGLCMLVI